MQLCVIDIRKVLKKLTFGLYRQIVLRNLLYYIKEDWIKWVDLWLLRGNFGIIVVDIISNYIRVYRLLVYYDMVFQSIRGVGKEDLGRERG